MISENPRFVRAVGDTFASYAWEDVLWSAGLLLVAGAGGGVASSLAVRGFQRWSKRHAGSTGALVVTRFAGPLRWVGPLLAIDLALPVVTLPAGLREGLHQGFVVAMIAGACWLALRAVGIAETVVAGRFDVARPDNLHARAVYTQMRGLTNVASFLIVVISLAFALLSFDRVRQLGAGLLASAGLAGVVLGFAAQKSLAALLSGIQIAFTQPIRLDDVVVVEGEWGRIEEITLTYVVLKTWDGRRLVVPIGYFLEKPFQNWTRRDARLLATVELHLAPATPLDELRREVERRLRESKLWDGRTWAVQVTDLTESAIVARVLMGARDAGTAFDLRCEIREKLVAYLQQDHSVAEERPPRWDRIQ